MVSHYPWFTHVNGKHYHDGYFHITCNKTMIEIYGKPQCPFCDRAKALCEQKGYEYTYKQLGVDFDRDFILEEFPGARTFPQIRIDGKNIGGYTELDAWSSISGRHLTDEKL